MTIGDAALLLMCIVASTAIGIAVLTRTTTALLARWMERYNR